MKIIRAKKLQYIPASHEDPINPHVFKKVLFRKDDLVKGSIQMINWAKLPVGEAFQKHYHEDMDEIFIILNGKTRIIIDNKEDELEKGDAVLTPMRHAHKMENICDEDVEYIVIGITRGKSGKTVVVG